MFPAQYPGLYPGFAETGSRICKSAHNIAGTEIQTLLIDSSCVISMNKWKQDL